MTSHKKDLSHILAPVSLGELIDKITILEIKKKNMVGNKLKNVTKELELLTGILKNKNLDINIKLVNHLREVNNNLWKIEDQIRIKESNKQFDEEFIELARSVYQENDSRAFIKHEINQTYNSEIIEEKSYNKY